MSQTFITHEDPSQLNDVATPPASQAWRDWLGIGASVTCAIHCAAMPFVVGLLRAGQCGKGGRTARFLAP